MIIVSVHLVSAVNGQVTELGRMRICNDGTSIAARKGNYTGETFVGRRKDDLDRGMISKRGAVIDYPRERLHVWNLVARMLRNMGYTK